MRELLVRVSADATSLRGAMQTGVREVDKLDKKVRDTDKTLRGFAAIGLAAIAAGAVALVVGLTAAGVAAIGFEQSMRNVQSLTRESDESFRALTESVLELSNEGPARARELADALYDVTSAGFAGAQGLEVLEVSADAAAAGLTETKTAAGAITASLNAYGRSASDAEDVSDVLFKTVESGVITFEELSGAIGVTAAGAAAAGVPLDDLSSAIATVTLSGLQSRQAATAVNATIRAIASPSDALRRVYDALGIESGEALIAQEGLAGAITLVGEASGGSIAGLQALLGDQEAVRGAAALLANEGRTYAGVLANVSDETTRAGATQAALAEQSKSTAFQLEQVRKTAENIAIGIGVQVLPIFNNLLAVMLDLAQRGGPVLEGAFARVQPLLAAIYGTGVNVVEIIGALWKAVAPLVGALAELAGTTVVGTLTAIAMAAEATTGFLADHRDIVIAVAAVYLATLLPSVSQVTVALSRLQVAGILGAVRGLDLMAAGALRARAALTALTTAVLSFQAVATAGLALVIYGAVRGFTNLSTAASEAESAFAGATDGINAADTKAAQAALAELRGEAEASLAVYEDLGGTDFTRQFRAGRNAFFGDNSIAEAAYQGREAAAAMVELQTQVDNANANLRQLADDTGLPIGKLRELAVANDIDLSKPIADSADERRELLGYLDDLAAGAGIAGDSLIDNFGGQSIEAITELNEKVNEFVGSVDTAFTGATDVIATWRPDIGVAELEAATDRVADAQERLEEVKRRNAESDGDAADEARNLARAEDDLADAIADQADAQTAAAEGTLAGFYARRIEDAQAFSDGITEALARGLDPDYVARLMAQGPEQAGPILQEILSDSSGALIAMVNESEAQLAELNLIVVEQARLTALAVNSTTDQLTTDLALAMQISREVLTAEGAVTAAEVAESLEIPTSEARRIGEEFGITFLDSAQATLSSRTLAPPAVRAAAARAATGTGTAGGYATGGYITGPGTKTSDSIHVMVSTGEYVQQAAAVDYYGVGFMEAVNQRRLPRHLPGYANGGYVTTAGASAPRVVEVTSSHLSERYAPIHIDRVVTTDAASFREEALSDSAARLRR